MKWVVRSVLVFLALAVLVVGGAFVMLATFDPNSYKEKITVAVENATGREFKIAGDIKTSLFPVPGFEISDIRMHNPPAFADKEFLRVGSVQAGVAIMPLLKKRIELTKVILNEPSIKVIRKSDGHTNLDFSNSSKPKIKGSGDTPAMNLSVGAIEINQARLLYNDQNTGNIVTIDPLNMTLPGYVPGTETDVAIDMIVKFDDSTMKVDGTAKAKAAPQEGTLDLLGLNAHIIMAATTLAEDVNVKLAGQGRVNIKTQDLDLTVPDVTVNWQGTDIQGKATIGGKFSAPVTSFSVSAATVNLDGILRGIKKDGRKGDPNRPLLPVDMLRNLNMSGHLAIQELLFNELSIKNVQARILADAGLVKIEPMTADFYEGRANANVTIDVRPSVPVFNVKNNVSGVKIGQVLKAKMGQDYITGDADVSYDINSAGNSIKALRQAVGGTIQFKFDEGYINKWQISRLLNQAISFFKTGTIGEDVSDRIYFTEMTATFNGQNGVLNNNDLTMMGPEIHALGNGVINLAGQNVDYNINVGLGAEPNSEAKYLPISIKGPLSKPGYKLATEVPQ